MYLEKILLQKLMAFLPVYLDMKGNCTLLYTYCGGIYEIEKTIRTVLNQLGNYYLVDLKATKKYYGDLLAIKNLVPIPFDKDNIFVPIKVRKPLFKNDGSLGYVNIKYIKKVRKLKNNTIIYLVNNHTIECLNSIETVNRHIKNGNIVERLWKERHSTAFVSEYNFYKEYNLPATKGDIALLREEILKIKETIK